MFFELTPELVSKISFAMDDQTVMHALDSRDGTIVEIMDASQIDGENLYEIPHWDSHDGFEFLRSWTNKLHAPMARNELNMVIASGRGVFRNFKNVLRAYPEVEKKFHIDKNEVFKSRIKDWYNGLCEVWGLEQLYEEFSDSEDEVHELVQDDFEFHQYSFQRDGNDVVKGLSFVAEDFENRFDDERGKAITFLCRSYSQLAVMEEKKGFVCRSQTEEFLGCILFSPFPEDSRSTVGITDFFVLPNSRGLGIGEELLSKCMALLKKNGVKFALISNIIPEEMKPLLVRFGFENQGSIYLADL